MTLAALLLLVGGVRLGLARTDRTEIEKVHALREQASRLIHDNACRRAEVELAKGERFYLLLDPGQRSLSLKLHGTLLRELSLDSIEIGRPRRLFFDRHTRDEVRARPHRHGRLVPRRPLLRIPVEVPEDADEAETIMLPPEPESAIVVPRRFFIRYDDEVVLEFRTDGNGIDLRRRIGDAFAALLGRPELRLRLGLDRAAAEAFFRAVPRETDLLVL